MTTKEKLELLADMLEIEVDDFNEETALDDIEEWDSLNALSFIVLVDENFGKTLTADTINACDTVGDLLKLMN